MVRHGWTRSIGLTVGMTARMARGSARGDRRRDARRDGAPGPGGDHGARRGRGDGRVAGAGAPLLRLDGRPARHVVRAGGRTRGSRRPGPPCPRSMNRSSGCGPSSPAIPGPSRTGRSSSGSMPGPRRDADPRYARPPTGSTSPGSSCSSSHREGVARPVPSVRGPWRVRPGGSSRCSTVLRSRRSRTRSRSTASPSSPVSDVRRARARGLRRRERGPASVGSIRYEPTTVPRSGPALGHALGDPGLERGERRRRHQRVLLAVHASRRARS